MRQELDQAQTGHSRKKSSKHYSAKYIRLYFIQVCIHTTMYIHVFQSKPPPPPYTFKRSISLCTISIPASQLFATQLVRQSRLKLISNKSKKNQEQIPNRNTTFASQLCRKVAINHLALPRLKPTSGS